MSIRIVLNRSTVAFLLASLTLTQVGIAAKDDKNRHQAFIRGDGDETRLIREIRHQLVMLPYYGVFDDLSFRVDPDGTVTLMGAVTRPTLKSDAENVVKHIEGVTKVVNQIEVLPLSPEDDRIRMAVARTVSNQGGLFRYFMGAVPSIHIIVDSGHVTLKGFVDNEGDKTQARLAANRVPGVFSVTDELQVANSSKG